MTVTASVLIDDTLTHDGDWQFIEILEDSTSFEVLSGTMTMCSGSISSRTFSKGDYLMGTFRRIKMSAGRCIANTQAKITA